MNVQGVKGLNVLFRIAIVVACTLAGGRDERSSLGMFSSGSKSNNSKRALNMSQGNNNHSKVPVETCPMISSCSVMQDIVDIEHVIYPYAISVAFLSILLFVTLLSRMKYKSLAIKALMWILCFNFIALWLTYFIIFHVKDRIFSYTWSLHAASASLATFAPKQSLVPNQVLFFLAPLLSTACLCAFAKEQGPSIGIVSWSNVHQAQCGWIAHFKAVMCVDLLVWILSPVGRALWAL
jgi:hypothetical protein